MITNEQTIVSTVLEKLNQKQLATTQQVIDAIEKGQIPEEDLQKTLTELQHTLAEIQQNGVLLSDPTLASISERMLEVSEAAKLDVNHKLKVTVPIIPLILSYEGEVGLHRELHLKTVWQKLLDIVKIQ